MISNPEFRNYNIAITIFINSRFIVFMSLYLRSYLRLRQCSKYFERQDAPSFDNLP